MRIGSRIDRLSRRWARTDGPDDFVLVLDPGEIRAANAVAPPVRSGAEALGLLAMLGQPIAPELVARMGIAARARIVERFGRMVDLSPVVAPMVPTMAEALARLSGLGFRMEGLGHG